MSDQPGPMSSSASRIQSLLEAHAPDFRLEQWQREILASWYLATTVRPQERPTALTRQPRSAPARYTLRLTWWLTPHDMGYPWLERLSTAPIPPAIHALAFSLIQESSKWCSIANIEMILGSGSSPM